LALLLMLGLLLLVMTQLAVFRWHAEPHPLQLWLLESTRAIS
jgi:hypothetical protein